MPKFGPSYLNKLREGLTYGDSTPLVEPFKNYHAKTQRGRRDQMRDVADLVNHNLGGFPLNHELMSDVLGTYIIEVCD